MDCKWPGRERRNDQQNPIAIVWVKDEKKENLESDKDDEKEVIEEFQTWNRANLIQGKHTVLD